MYVGMILCDNVGCTGVDLGIQKLTSTQTTLYMLWIFMQFQLTINVKFNTILWDSEYYVIIISFVCWQQQYAMVHKQSKKFPKRNKS